MDKINPGDVGHLTGVPTGFPTGSARCTYLGRVNGMHAFRSSIVNATAFITDEQFAEADWSPLANDL